MKPILFNTEMVRAVLDGRKTVTRRVAFKTDELREFPCASYPNGWWFRGRVYVSRRNAMDSVEGVMRLCKYRPGDILWVRETWARPSETEIAAGAGQNKFLYKADDPAQPCAWDRWHPSIHMPREAARIFLQVTNVRVERLQQITNEDVSREGITPRWYGGGCKCSAYEPGCMDNPCGNRDAYERMCYGTPFLELWDRNIKPANRPAYGWDANPWVWVIEFERIRKEEAQKNG